MEDSNARDRVFDGVVGWIIYHVSLLKMDSTTDALPSNLTILKIFTEKIWGGANFFSIVLCGRLESSNCLKNNSSKGDFLVITRKTLKLGVFPNTS